MNDQELLDALAARLGIEDIPAESGRIARLEEGASKARNLIELVKENLAYIAGLPAALGALGWTSFSSSGNEADLTYKVDQLTAAVADLKAQNDLLGGGGKNFSIDMAGAPAASILPIVLILGAAVVLGLTFWIQKKNRRKKWAASRASRSSLSS